MPMQAGSANGRVSSDSQSRSMAASSSVNASASLYETISSDAFSAHAFPWRATWA